MIFQIPFFVMEKITELHNRDTSRRNKVPMDGIPETAKETCGNCEEELRKIIRNQLDITDDIEIDRCHRMGKFEKKQIVTTNSCL